MKWQKLFLKRPSWKYIFLRFGVQWTPQAIECMDIDSDCSACTVPPDIRVYCRTKYLVPKLLQVFGNPRRDEYYMNETLRFIKSQKVVSPPLLKKHFKKWRKSFKWKAILDQLVNIGMMKKERTIIRKQRRDGTFYKRWSGYHYHLIEGHDG